jgi:hypothetical protein
VTRPSRPIMSLLALALAFAAGSQPGPRPARKRSSVLGATTRSAGYLVSIRHQLTE